MTGDASGRGRHRLSSAALAERAASLRERYPACDCCPHECGVDRTAGERGVCGLGDVPVVASSGPHHGEERPLRGTGGSGTIFLAGCNMRCVFCQNDEISQAGRGTRTTPADLATRIEGLADAGCHNVNFVTPTHVAPSLVEAVAIARDRGVDLPVVWNCGGYERRAVVAELDGVVDVYMPDLKWADEEAARRYSGAPDYWEHARSAAREMHRQVGDLQTDAAGVATRGLLVRHLVMPNHVENSKQVLRFVAEELSADTYVNVMGQYRPCYLAAREERYADLGRPVSREEYREVVAYARDLGLSRLDVDERLL
jgi:putative pyruvate formate lyase activating enzyme